MGAFQQRAGKGYLSDSFKYSSCLLRASEFCVVLKELITCCDYKDNTIPWRHQNAFFSCNFSKLPSSHLHVISLSFHSNQKQVLLKWLSGMTDNIKNGKGEWLTHLLNTWDASTSFYFLMPNLLNEWGLCIASISWHLMIAFTTAVRLRSEWFQMTSPFVKFNGPF